MMMTIATGALLTLNEAIQTVNEGLVEKGYAVGFTNEKVEPKEPIFLQLKYNNETTRNIGITHLVHLKGSNWDEQPFEALARSTDEVVQAIVDRIALFFDAQARKLYIDESGTIFDFKEVSVILYEDKTFSIADKMVTFGEKPLSLTRLKSEGIIEFRQMENGHIELFDSIDKREKKGIFIDTDAKIYRA
jgi:hypothetical protein